MKPGLCATSSQRKVFAVRAFVAITARREPGGVGAGAGMQDGLGASGVPLPEMPE